MNEKNIKLIFNVFIQKVFSSEDFKITNLLLHKKA